MEVAVFALAVGLAATMSSAAVGEVARRPAEWLPEREALSPGDSGGSGRVSAER